MTSLISFRDRILEAGRWSLLLCLFFVPIDKPATNIFIFLALLCALFGSRTRERWLAACKQPVVIGAAAWFLVLVFSALHAPAGTNRWHELAVYKALLYPFIAAMLLETQQWRTRGIYAFAIAVTGILVISWIQFLGAPPMPDITVRGDLTRYTVFKDYSQQGIAFLVLASLSASFANIEAVIKRKRIFWIIAAAALLNVAFILQSRTSYVIVIPLLLYWAWRLIGKRYGVWLSLAAGLTALTLISATAAFNPRAQQRVIQIERDLVQYMHDDKQPTSLSVRLELWKHTVPIVLSAPVFGHGVGQWRHEYELQVKNLPDYSAFKMGHPHQEALSILSEEGIIGFALFVLLLILLFRHIRKLDLPYRDFYTCLLLIYVTAGLANCILIDFSHRHLFLMLLACMPFRARDEADRKIQAA